MSFKKPEFGLFITGTGTEVGKTFVSALIIKSLVAKGIKVGVYKPVASGCDKVDGEVVSEDAQQLWQAAGKPLSLHDVCPQMFVAPIAPHLAARDEQMEIDAQKLRTGLSAWADECEIIIVEGVGGLMSPLSDDEFVADLAVDFGYPLIVVSPNRLGTINETLQTLITAETFQNGLPVAGVVLNDLNVDATDPSRASNREQLARFAVPPILAHVKVGDSKIDAEIDWPRLSAGI